MTSNFDDNIWLRRLSRLNRRARRDLSDLGRAVSWQFGGRRFFNRFSDELKNGHKWVFIVGCNNSGTSLLQSLLLQTGQVSTFAAEGQMYTRVLGRSERKGHERVWSEFSKDLVLSDTETRNLVPRLVHDWMTALTPPIRHVILEKTPANVVRMDWLQTAFPNSYFIGLVRNAYAVSEGIRRKGRKPLARGARHWNEVSRLLVENSAKVNKFIEIRYEELADSPGETLAKLMTFLGLESEPCDQHGASRPVIRQDHAAVRNFNSESIARLTGDDLKIIYENAKPMIDHYGYPRI